MNVREKTLENSAVRDDFRRRYVAIKRAVSMNREKDSIEAFRLKLRLHMGK
jgi:hypothetical protein